MAIPLLLFLKELKLTERRGLIKPRQQTRWVTVNTHVRAGTLTDRPLQSDQTAQ